MVCLSDPVEQDSLNSVILRLFAGEHIGAALNKSFKSSEWLIPIRL
jgi:hypothetical protein